jgi:hypothetical protein
MPSQYCNRDCQGTAWKTDGHRVACGKLCVDVDVENMISDTCFVQTLPGREQPPPVFATVNMTSGRISNRTMKPTITPLVVKNQIPMDDKVKTLTGMKVCIKIQDRSDCMLMLRPDGPPENLSDAITSPRRRASAVPRSISLSNGCRRSRERRCLLSSKLTFRLRCRRQRLCGNVI